MSNNKKTLYKTQIPNEWDVISILQLAEGKKELFDDGDWVEAEFLTDYGIRLIQTGNIGEGVFINKLKNKKYISEESFVKLKCKELYEGDLLICRLADPAGRACILPNIGEGKMITSVDVSIFRPKKDLVDRNFLVANFSTDFWFNEIRERCGGSTRTRIARGELGKIKVPLPPLPEQKAIAAVLSTWDAAISKTQALLAQKELRKKWLMQNLLTGKMRLKINGELKIENGEWKEVRMGDVSEIDKRTLSNQTPDDYSFQYLSLSDVDVGVAEIKKERLIFKDSPSRARRIVKQGDILLATVRPNLQGFVIIRDDVKDLIASTGFAVISCTKINNEFLFQYLFTKNLMNQIESFLTGSNYPAINSSDVRNLKIPFPSIEEQTAIAQVLQAADKEISLLKAKADKLKEQKKGLMQMLLTGKKRLLLGKT